MTPTELAALPKGTCVMFDLYPVSGFDFGTVVQAGAVCHIQWDGPPYDKEGGSTNIIDTKNIRWEKFISDIYLDTPPESV